MDTEPTLRQFFNGWVNIRVKPFAGGYNLWTQQGHVNAYLRLCRRNMSTGLSNRQAAAQGATRYTVEVLDIANISVEDEKQGKGLFRLWYAQAEELAREYNLGGIYFENVLNPTLQSFCERHGFKVVPGSLPVCYFKDLTSTCPRCGRDLEDAEELKTGLCTSDDCLRHDKSGEPT